jgi:hypothetical protein
MRHWEHSNSPDAAKKKWGRWPVMVRKRSEKTQSALSRWQAARLFILLKPADRTFQVDCVPEDDCGRYQVESAGAIPLILKGSVSHLAEAVKEYRAGSRGFFASPLFRPT